MGMLKELIEPLGKALALLSAMRMTAHLHNFSDDQIKLMDEVIGDIRAVLYEESAG